MARLAQLMPWLVGAALRDKALAAEILTLRRETLDTPERRWLEAIAAGDDGIARHLASLGIERVKGETVVAALLRVAKLESERTRIQSALGEADHAARLLGPEQLADWFRRQAEALEAGRLPVEPVAGKVG